MLSSRAPSVLCCVHAIQLDRTVAPADCGRRLPGEDSPTSDLSVLPPVFSVTQFHKDDPARLRAHAHALLNLLLFPAEDAPTYVSFTETDEEITLVHPCTDADAGADIDADIDADADADVEAAADAGADSGADAGARSGAAGTGTGLEAGTAEGAARRP